jgi:hypothetical protein
MSDPPQVGMMLDPDLPPIEPSEPVTPANVTQYLPAALPTQFTEADDEGR